MISAEVVAIEQQEHMFVHSLEISLITLCIQYVLVLSVRCFGIGTEYGVAVLLHFLIHTTMVAEQLQHRVKP